MMVPWGPKHVAVESEIQSEDWLIVKPRLLRWRKPLGEPRANLDAVEKKILPLPGIEPRPSNP
jgi:hypothetical protein